MIDWMPEGTDIDEYLDTYVTYKRDGSPVHNKPQSEEPEAKKQKTNKSSRVPREGSTKKAKQTPEQELASVNSELTEWASPNP